MRLLLKGLRILFMLFILLLGKNLYSLPSDNSHPMQLSSDTSLINYKTGIYTYDGAVKIKQGSTELLADRVITKNNAKHKIEEATAYGFNTLAEYITTPKDGDKPLHAKAKIIRYFPLKSTVLLQNNVIVSQGDNNFHGELIIYNMKDQIITAPAASRRSTIIIDPKQISS